MDMTKVEQIKEKICDYMLSMDLSKLPTYELVTYIQAYKTLEGMSSFPGLGFGNLGYASSMPIAPCV